MRTSTTNVFSLFFSDILTGFSFGIFTTYIMLFLYDLGFDYVYLGLLNSIYFVSSVIWGFLGGHLADRFGRKITLALGRGLFVLMFILIAYGQISYIWIIFFLEGAGYAISGTAREALLGESLAEEERGFYYNLINSMFGLGYGIGAYYCALQVKQYGLIKVFYTVNMVAALMGLVATIALIFLRETFIKSGKRGGVGLRYLINKNFLKLFLVTVILFVGLEFLWLYISLYAVEALGVTEAEWGVLNAVLFPLNALLSPILGKIADKIRLRVSLFMGATLIYLYSLLLAFPLGIGAIYLGCLFVIDIIGEGFLWPSFFKIELELTDKETRGRVFGLVTSLTEIVRAGIAPGIGIIYSKYKRAIFLIGGHLILVLSPIAFKRKEKE